jgi:glycosyltransferase involved in cell wall biosynthesis
MISTREAFTSRKICVLVPTYNNATTLGTVLRNLLSHTNDIVVVNDGSTDETSEVLKSFPEIQTISYKQNQGKGFALRTGFEFARSKGYDYAITIDSDGQHSPEDLVQFLPALENHPDAIIIGARNMEQASVPGKSSFGNKFSNFWFWVETGIRRNDTQSGYRLYPISSLANLKFITNKFEFEIEVIVKAAWAGVEVIEVPVKVFYPEKEKRISHFRPWRDFTRISILNTFLVAIAFLYIKPRDFVRTIKKKISGRSYASLLLTQMNLISSKQVLSR